MRKITTSAKYAYFSDDELKSTAQALEIADSESMADDRAIAIWHEIGEEIKRRNP